MFTYTERIAVSKLIVAAERVLAATDVNTAEQVDACRDLRTILMAITAVINESRDRPPGPTLESAS